MPTQLLRACTYPGCNQLVAKGRCSQHPYARKPLDRPSTVRRGYDGRWLGIRERYLRYHPFCELKAKCNGAEATEVDHIVPIRQGGDYTASNLQAVCKRCHSYKTATFDTTRDQRGRFSGQHSTSESD